MRPGKPGAMVKNRAEAVAKVVAKGQWTQERCEGCTELKIVRPHTSASASDVPGTPTLGLPA
eukprot:scaffold35872_cov45-Phaeocystis_antarctica.AAC.1